MSEGPSLLDELGLDESTLSWHQLAFCNDMPLDLFYETYEEDQETAKAVDEVCLSCPVMKECLMDAIDRKDFGVRGAIYLINGKTDRARNAHKTPEVWARIKDKLE